MVKRAPLTVLEPRLDASARKPFLKLAIAGVVIVVVSGASLSLASEAGWIATVTANLGSVERDQVAPISSNATADLIHDILHPVSKILPSAGRTETWLIAPNSKSVNVTVNQSASCKTPKRRPGSFRVVSDPTIEDGVRIIADRLVNASLPRKYPQPVMTGRNGQLFTEFCRRFAGEENWRRQCPQGSTSEHNWWVCDYRQIVAMVPCGYLDTDNTIPCMAYDADRTFPVHGNHPSKSKFQPMAYPPRKVVEVDAIAHNVAVYPFATAHWFAQFPRLVYLLQALPANVKILLADHPLKRQMVDIMAQRKLLDPSRVINWQQGTTYHAKQLYFAGELGLGPSTGGRWDSLRFEKCSWAMGLPRSQVQKMFTQDYVQKSGSYFVLVVHRSDAGSRKVANHEAMMHMLKETLSNSTCEIFQFVGKQHSLSATIDLFKRADVVIAPHGAALGFMPFLRPGRAVVEIGYKDAGGMSFPGSYYMAITLSVGAKYFLTMADGTYSSSLTVDLEDIAILARWAVGNVTLLPIGARAWTEA